VQAAQVSETCLSTTSLCSVYILSEELVLVSLLVSYGGMRLNHLVRRPLTGLLYQPRLIDEDCGAVGGTKVGRGNRSSQKKPAPVPLCPPRITHDLTWARTRAAAVGSRGLNRLSYCTARVCRI
jgi:hypothetical protein